MPNVKQLITEYFNGGLMIDRALVPDELRQDNPKEVAPKPGQ